MKKFSNETIDRIENTLQLHSDYSGKYNDTHLYLKEMDAIAIRYPGPKAFALHCMLDDYFKQVGVSSLQEAFNRIRNKKINHEN